MAVVRSPIFDLMRGCGRAIAGMASGSGAPTTSSPGPRIDRRAAIIRVGVTSSVAVVGPSLLLGCPSAPFVVLNDEPRILAVRNGSGSISPEFQAEVLAEYARLPDPIRKLLRDNRYELLLKVTVDDHGIFGSKKIGTHIPRQIIVGECVMVGGSLRCNNDTGKILRHEVGHAVDWHYRPDPLDEESMLSSSAAFYHTMDSDMRSHKDATKDAVRTRLSDHGYSGKGHGVDPYDVDWYRNAEVFAILFAELVDGNTTEPLYRYLPRTTNFVRAHGLQRPAREY